MCYNVPKILKHRAWCKLFSKGDKIVYPLYGAGVIEEIEEKEIDGDMHTYYVVAICVLNLKIKVSSHRVDGIGIRAVCGKDRILSLIDSANSRALPICDNWNQRYKENMEKIKTGNLQEVALVYRSLLIRERQRGLSSAEKKMLTTAKQIILSELILSYEIEKREAEEILLNTIHDHCS